MPGVLSQDKVEIKIANITFAFDNVDILKLLSKRGYYVTYANYKKITEIENTINALKNAETDKVSRPVAAFITFEN